MYDIPTETLLLSLVVSVIAWCKKKKHAVGNSFAELWIGSREENVREEEEEKEEARGAGERRREEERKGVRKGGSGREEEERENRGCERRGGGRGEGKSSRDPNAALSSSSISPKVIRSENQNPGNTICWPYSLSPHYPWLSSRIAVQITHRHLKNNSLVPLTNDCEIIAAWGQEVTRTQRITSEGQQRVGPYKHKTYGHINVPEKHAETHTLYRLKH